MNMALVHTFTLGNFTDGRTRKILIPPNDATNQIG